jgi:hypothetical protein
METYNSLTMITKAGVSANKIMVGISSYGRQFKMTDPNCSHMNCTYVGPNSAATPGRCTNVPEYISNAEIQEIIMKDPTAKVISTSGNSKHMTYSGNWVSYMDENDKIARTNLWKSLNFGGTVEWAVDLNSFEYDLKGSNKDTSGIDFGMGMRGDGTRAKQTAANACLQDDSWRSVLCTTPGIANSSLKAVAQWYDVKADAAWCAAIKYWTKERDAGTNQQNFTETIVTWFLKGPSQFRCEDLDLEGHTGCVKPQLCADARSGSAPSMQLIGTSLHNIYSVRDHKHSQRI